MSVHVYNPYIEYEKEIAATLTWKLYVFFGTSLFHAKFARKVNH